MPKNSVVQIPASSFTLLTEQNIVSISFQVSLKAIMPVIFVGTIGETPPITLDGVAYEAGQGEYNIPLSEMFPGIAATRVYAFCARPTTVFVSYA